MNTQYTADEQRIAYDIARTLNDLDSITLHLQFARKYQESFLREQLNKVMAIDPANIKKSRAALYTFLISKHGSQGRAGH